MKNKMYLYVALAVLMTASTLSGCKKNDKELSKDAPVDIGAEQQYESVSVGEEVLPDWLSEEEMKFDFQASDYLGEIEYSDISVSKEKSTKKEEQDGKQFCTQANEWILQRIEKQDLYEKKMSGQVSILDILCIDCEATQNGKDIIQLTDQYISVGSGEIFGPEFDKNLTGKEIGDTVEFDCMVAESEQYPDLAGENLHFRVSIKYRREMPYLTDELAKKMSDGQYKTMDLYMDYVEKLMALEDKWQQRDAAVSEVLDELVLQADIEAFPDEMVSEKEISEEKYQEYARQLQIPVEKLKEECQTNAYIRKQVLGQDKATMSYELVIQYIAEKEGLFLTQEDYNQLYNELYVKRNLKDKKEAALVYDMDQQKKEALKIKVSEFIYDNLDGGVDE